MDFNFGRRREEPEINLIPLIDVLLVILIFLMITTTYSRFTELEINLPTAEADPARQEPSQVQVAVDAHGQYAVNNAGVRFVDVGQFADALRKAAGNAKDPVVVINADAKASHQSVITVMEAARQAGLVRITFATQPSGR